MLLDLILTHRCSNNEFQLLSYWYTLPNSINKTIRKITRGTETHSYGFIYNILKHSRNLQSLTTASVWKELADFWHGFCHVWFCWLCKLIWTGKASIRTLREEWKKGKKWKKFLLQIFLDVFIFTERTKYKPQTLH